MLFHQFNVYITEHRSLSTFGYRDARTDTQWGNFGGMGWSITEHVFCIQKVFVEKFHRRWRAKGSHHPFCKHGKQEKYFSGSIMLKFVITFR